MICRHFLDQLKETPIESDSGVTPDEEAEVIAIQNQVACSIEEFFTEDGLVVKCLEYAFELNHIMEPAKLRMLDTIESGDVWEVMETWLPFCLVPLSYWCVVFPSSF